jgi:hypothetical protein
VANNCTLPSKGQETGSWTATISGPTGAPQIQYMAAISYPIRLVETSTITATYRPESLSEKPEPPCLGSVNEPIAEPGNLCVYRGGNFGSEEKQDKNASFNKFEFPNGKFAGPLETGNIGTLVVFRAPNAGFKEEGTAPETLKTPAYLSAGGSWALTEK